MLSTAHCPRSQPSSGIKHSSAYPRGQRQSTGFRVTCINPSAQKGCCAMPSNLGGSHAAALNNSKQAAWLARWGAPAAVARSTTTRCTAHPRPRTAPCGSGCPGHTSCCMRSIPNTANTHGHAWETPVAVHGNKWPHGSGSTVTPGAVAVNGKWGRARHGHQPRICRKRQQ